MSDATYEGRMPTIDDFCDPEPNEQKECFLDIHASSLLQKSSRKQNLDSQ